MKPWSTREGLRSRIVALASQGTSRRAIARALGVSRNTVRRLLEEHQQARDVTAETALERATPRRAPRATKLDPYHERIAELLEAWPDITAQRIFEEVTSAGYDGGYTRVKDYVRGVRPPARPKPSKPTPVYGPAKMAESDWSPHRIEFTHAPTAVVQVFAYVLVHSTRKHFALYERCDLHALMAGHVETFARFGGAAHVCKYDSQKAVVLGWEGSQPIYNPRFLAFSAHYEFRPWACRRWHPNDKPRVERAFWEFEQSFLNARSFRDLDDMRAQLLAWEDAVADPRPRRRPGSQRPRMELFAEEQPLLRRLPAHAYDTARVVYRLCAIDGFISWDGNRYAVPYDHVTDFLPIRVTQHELFVYAADLRCVAQHELARRSAGAKIGAERYHPSPAWPRRHGAIGLDRLAQAFADMGEEAEAFFEALRATLPRLAGYQARRILLLRERYATTDLCDALRHARAYGAFEHQAVERILDARSTPRRLAEYVAEGLARRLALDGGAETQPRDLTEFDRLPVAGRPTSAQEKPCPDDEPPPTSSSSGCDEPSRSSD